MLAKAFQQTHVWPTSYSCLEFPRTARTGNWFPRMENAGNPASENLQWRKLVSENPVCRKPRFPRITDTGSPVSEKNPSRQDTETWPCPSALMRVYLSDPEAKISSLLARGLLTSR